MERRSPDSPDSRHTDTMGPCSSCSTAAPLPSPGPPHRILIMQPTSVDQSERYDRALENGANRRFARDAHDLIGFSLSAITLKSELAARLIDHDIARARLEMSEVQRLSREAVAHIRALAEGTPQLSLPQEVATARDLLSSSGIDVTTWWAGQLTNDRMDLELALVLREAVTNVLRHSDATRCAIRFRQHRQKYCLQVSNDGVRSATSVDRRPRSGLNNLAIRVAGFGGRLLTKTRRNCFDLVVECPVT